MDLISIVVPCFNEQEALPIFYKEALPYFDKINANYEVIFVDDGSKDQTAKIMKELSNILFFQEILEKKEQCMLD